MTLVIPVDHALIVHKHRISGDPEPMLITYGVKCDVAAASADVIAAAAAAAWGLCLQTWGSVYVSMFETEAQWQNLALPAAPQIGIDSTVYTGSNTGNIVPQNSALLAHKRTAFGGRGGRGRFYIPGVREGDVDNVGTVDPTQVGNWNDGLSAMLSDLLVTDVTDYMVVLHDDAGAFAADTPHPVTSLTLDGRIATQRRRLRR